MGQYHWTVNLSKKQFLEPHKLGDGLKLSEQCGWSPGGVNDALHLLLACSNGRGGGDFQSEDPLIGSWAGDRIAVIGDYAEPDDIKVGRFNARRVIAKVMTENGTEYEDISDRLIPILEREYECVYVGNGWRQRFSLENIEGYRGSHGVGDRLIIIDDAEFRASEVRQALHNLFCDPAYERTTQITARLLGITPVYVRTLPTPPMPPTECVKPRKPKRRVRV